MITLPPDHPYHCLEKSRYALKMELEYVLATEEPVIHDHGNPFYLKQNTQYQFYGVNKHDLIEYLKDEFAKAEK